MKSRITYIRGPTRIDLLPEITVFREAHEMTRYRFGRLAVKDPKFIPQLEDGRKCGSRIARKVRRFMREYKV